jgi:hypothetical protein
LEYLARRTDVDQAIRDAQEHKFTAAVDRIHREAEEARALDDLNVTTSKAQAQQDIMIRFIENLPQPTVVPPIIVDPPVVDPVDPDPTDEPKPVVKTPKRIRTMHARQVSDGSQWRIKNDEDIDRYLNQLRSQLKAKLAEADEIDINF